MREIGWLTGLAQTAVQKGAAEYSATADKLEALFSQMSLKQPVELLVAPGKKPETFTEGELYAILYAVAFVELNRPEVKRALENEGVWSGLTSAAAKSRNALPTSEETP